MKRDTIDIVFWALVAVFVILLAYIFVPFEKAAMFVFMAVLGILLLLLGILLLVMTIKSKVKGKRRMYLQITALSAISLFVFSILHNVFYALAILSENIAVLNYLFQALEVVSFLISIPVSPIAFLVGAFGYIFKKK